MCDKENRKQRIRISVTRRIGIRIRISVTKRIIKNKNRRNKENRN